MLYIGSFAVPFCCVHMLLSKEYWTEQSVSAFHTHQTDFAMPPIRVPVSERGFGGSSSIAQSTPDQPQISFTRQLWQRNMPTDTEDSGSSTLSRSKRVSIGSSINNSEYPRPIEEIISEPHHSSDEHVSPNTPLTPEQSPPSRSTQKRSVDQIDEEEQSTPSHSRESSESYQPCLCRADPKVPRPRNGK